ncbi:MAG: DUF3891 family protein [Tepidisphaeraceae bacterium]|jgi:hypothetical protein
MIRRQTGKELILINQHDHSRLAGELARRIGNGTFAPPGPFESVVFAIAEHDCGWTAEDSRPQLNAQGQPEHVFEADVLTSLAAWQASVDQVMARDPYAGLLVSLHTMALANRAAAREPEALDETARHKTFRVRRFVHLQIEVQETLRRRLEMRADLPLRGGLAEQGRAPEEDLLRANFFLLELLDQLSLDLCFDELIFRRIETIYPRQSEGPMSARISSDGDGTMKLNPWPFNCPSVELDVPGRQIAAGPYRNAETLLMACDAGAACSVRVVLRPAAS